jgi:hypothetical protein
MEVNEFAKIGGSGVIGIYGIKLLLQWFRREHQDSSLYRRELEAHTETRTQLDNERKLRMEVEMLLSEARRSHDKDRDAWIEERDKDRELREELKDEVFKLRTEVKKLQASMNQQNAISHLRSA